MPPPLPLRRGYSARPGWPGRPGLVHPNLRCPTVLLLPLLPQLLPLPLLPYSSSCRQLNAGNTKNH